LTGLPATYGNSNVTTLLASFGSNTVSTTGNVTAGYVLGNGSLLTGLPATYGNSNVTTLLASFGSNAISTTGNVTAGYLIGNGSQITGLPANYGNAQVAAYLPTYTGNLVSLAGPVVTTANVTGAYILGNISGATGGYNNANVQSVLQSYSGTFTAATVSATGNVTGAYIIGNGSQLTGITSVISGNLSGNLNGDGYSITNVNVVNATGNVSGANITGTHYGSGTNLTGIPTSIAAGAGISVNASTGAVVITNNNPTPYANSNVASYLAVYSGNISAGNVNVVNNITGANITGTHFGSGGNLSNVVTSIVAGTGITINASTGAVTINGSTYGNANVASYLLTANSNIGSGTVTSTTVPLGITARNITAQTLTTTGLAVIDSIRLNTFIGTSSNLTLMSATSGFSTNLAVSATGNIIGGNITTAGLTSTATLSVTGNIVGYAEKTASIGNTNASFAPTYANGIVQNITANQSFTLQAPVGMTTGQSITLIITQDATGGRAMTPNAAYKFAYGIKTLSVSAGAIDMLSIFYDGTNYLCNLVKGYTA
jgi:hypothetical protein